MKFLKNLVKNIFKLIVLAIVLIMVADYAMVKMRKDVWLSFVYPNANNLYKDMDGGAYETLQACRSASLDLLERVGSSKRGDYECALNCNTSGGKPYICEETSR